MYRKKIWKYNFFIAVIYYQILIVLFLNTCFKWKFIYCGLPKLIETFGKNHISICHYSLKYRIFCNIRKFTLKKYETKTESCQCNRTIWMVKFFIEIWIVEKLMQLKDILILFIITFLMDYHQKLNITEHSKNKTQTKSWIFSLKKIISYHFSNTWFSRMTNLYQQTHKYIFSWKNYCRFFFQTLLNLIYLQFDASCYHSVTYNHQLKYQPHAHCQIYKLIE